MGSQPSSSRVIAFDAVALAPKKRPIHPKCSAAFSRAMADYWQSESRADRLGDCSRGYSGLGDGVQRGSGWCAFERQANETRRVDSVHRRPAVGTVTDVAGGTLFAGDGDQGGDETVITLSVDGRGEANARRTNTFVRQ